MDRSALNVLTNAHPVSMLHWVLANHAQLLVIHAVAQQHASHAARLLVTLIMDSVPMSALMVHLLTTTP